MLRFNPFHSKYALLMYLFLHFESQQIEEADGQEVVRTLCSQVLVVLAYFGFCRRGASRVLGWVLMAARAAREPRAKKAEKDRRFFFVLLRF